MQTKNNPTTIARPAPAVVSESIFENELGRRLLIPSLKLRPDPVAGP